MSLTPGKRIGLVSGPWASVAGNVAGRRPDGLTSPNSSAAIASPFCWPGYQASKIPATLLRQGVSVGPPVSSTTTVFGLAAATAWISASWSPGSASVGRSAPSVRMSLTNTAATSAPRAASIACCHCAGSGADQPSFRLTGNSPANPDLATYSTRIGTARPAGRSTATMFSWLALLKTSRLSMYRRAIPEPLNEKRCSPETVGVNVPVQRADHVPDRPGGSPVTCTVGSTRVITGVPLRSGEAKYSAVRPCPEPDAGISVAGAVNRRPARAGRPRGQGGGKVFPPPPGGPP